MKATIMQPTYLPWMGYFEMIDLVDIHVVLDHVQFEKHSWQQKNKIKAANGVTDLIVPVINMPLKTRICDIKLSYNKGNFLEKHWKSIEQAYKKAPYFKKYEQIFKNIYSKKYVLLRDLNVEIIKAIFDILGIKKKIIFSSALDLKDNNMEKTEKLINLCKNLSITDFYEPLGGKAFIDPPIFEKTGILVKFQNYKHPEYPQLWGEFVPYLSVIDLIFNNGDKSMEIIRSGRKT